MSDNTLTRLTGIRIKLGMGQSYIFAAIYKYYGGNKRSYDKQDLYRLSLAISPVGSNINQIYAC